MKPRAWAVDSKNSPVVYHVRFSDCDELTLGLYVFENNSNLTFVRVHFDSFDFKRRKPDLVFCTVVAFGASIDALSRTCLGELSKNLCKKRMRVLSPLRHNYLSYERLIDYT